MGKHVARSSEQNVFVPSASTPRRRAAKRAAASPSPVIELPAPQEASRSYRSANSSRGRKLSATETLIGELEPIRISDRQDTERIPEAEMVSIASAFANGARPSKRQPRRLEPHEADRLVAGTASLPIVALEDRVPVAPVGLAKGEKMVVAQEPRPERNRRLVQGIAASAVLLVGGGIGFAGTGVASAGMSSASLSASLVGGTAQEATVPAALTGKANASARSAVHDINAEAATSPMCMADGAKGLRAAYKNTAGQIVWPLAPGTYTLTSSFGTRIDPVFGTVRMHSGQDLAGPLGTPVYAVADGTVVETLGVNNMVRIKHEHNGEVFYTAYLHMYAKDILVKPGDTVKAGQRIGAIGNFGKSTGPHLHFETHNSAGVAQEPTSFMKAHGAIQITQMCK